MHDRLELSRIPERPRGLVLMFHGGAEYGERPVDHRSLALRRTRWMFSTLSEHFLAADVAVGLLAFTVKGWNARSAAEPSPVPDARAALAAIRADHPQLPVVLLGHSMGARTAVRVADQPGVVGVVGLAPWFPADDPVEALAAKHLVAVHGTRDRITSPKASRRYVRRAETVAASSRFVEMGGLGHYMLSGVKRWNRVALRESLNLVDLAAGPSTHQDSSTGEGHLTGH